MDIFTLADLLKQGTVTLGDLFLEMQGGAEKEYRPEPLKPRRMPFSKFDRMRALAKPGMSLPTAFRDQGEFMADFADQCPKAVPCDENYYGAPAYSRLSDAQLRTYFTWRAAVRRGETPPIGYGYIKLYLQELLVNIGVNKPREALQRVVDLYRAYAKTYAILDRIIARLVLGYYASNDLKMGFQETVAYYGLSPDLFPDRFWFDQWTGKGTFAMALRLSDYDIRHSTYYSAERLPQIEGAYAAAMEATQELFLRKKVKSEFLLWGRPHKQAWAPYDFVRYYYNHSPVDRRVDFCANDRCECVQDEYTRYAASDYYPGGRLLMGYLLKRVEMQLRVLNKFPYRLSPKAAKLAQALREANFRNKPFYTVLESSEFDQAIDAAVLLYVRGPQKPKEPPKIEVDDAALARIRREAEETQARLLVSEAEAARMPAPEGETDAARKSSKGRTAKPSAGAEAARTTAAGQGETEAPAGTDAARKSSKGRTAKPSDGAEAARTPAPEGETENSAGRDTARKSSEGRTAEFPAGLGATRTPVAEGEREAPAGTGAARKSSQGRMAKPPAGMARAGEEAPPATAASGFAGFLQALTEPQRAALAALLNGDKAALHRAAGRAGTLEAVLLEEINERALEAVGDNVVDLTAEPAEIYEDYRETLRKGIGG